MAFHNEDEKEKEVGVASEEALGEVFEAEPEDDEADPLMAGAEEDEKAWE